MGLTYHLAQPTHIPWHVAARRFFRRLMINLFIVPYFRFRGRKI